jgi:methylenetetrahydrofolate dehydrogenase (NADP+)/methenyltetrahydrofolate cyclohydrolase
MPTILLNGKVCAQALLTELQQKVCLLKKNLPIPHLAIIQVGSDPASSTYVRHKLEKCQQLGFQASHWQLANNVSPCELNKTIQQLNVDEHVHGILLQLPLAKGLKAEDYLSSIKPEKDVDGLHPTNLGLLVQHRMNLAPCTPKGIVQLLHFYNIHLSGLHAVIVNNSTLVGRPLALLLSDLGVTVTLCHSKTLQLDTLIRQADLVVSATGKTHFIQSSWLKPGCIAIDVGVHRQANGKLLGEFDFATAKDIAAYITPVPGGVGPVTVAQLMDNLWQAYLKQTT